MADTSHNILLGKAEIEAASKALLDELISIPLYDSEAKRRCIAKHIEQIQKTIAVRILKCDDGNPDIKARVSLYVIGAPLEETTGA